MDYILETTDLGIAFGGLKAAEHVNISIKKNEIYIIEIKKNVPEIIKDIGLIGETGFVISEVPNEEIVADENLKSAFINTDSMNSLKIFRKLKIAY